MKRFESRTTSQSAKSDLTALHEQPQIVYESRTYFNSMKISEVPTTSEPAIFDVDVHANSHEL